MSELALKVEKTARHYGTRSLRTFRGMLWDIHRPLAKQPVFVVGCSRAGTQLAYRTFAEVNGLCALKRETHDFWAALHPLAERNWRSHALSAGDARTYDRLAVSRYFYVHAGGLRFVDKNNQNGLSVPYLHELFPDASFVYVKRNPGDNIHSLIEGWGMPERFGTWSGHLPADIAIENGRYRRWCFFLPEGWRDYVQAGIEDVCAFQYRSMNEAILSARRAMSPSRWVEIRYEDVLADPVDSFREAITSLGLAFDKHLESHCESVLGRPYNAFSKVGKDKWQRGPNAEKIERVLPSVANVAREMGYE